MTTTSLIKKLGDAFVRRIDGFLLMTAMAIAGLGLLVLYSATDASANRVMGQAMNLAFALTVMWIAANVSPQHYLRWAVPLFALGVTLLVGVALFGTVVNGSRRWLSLGITRIQPSEMMKIAVPLLLAWYFNRRAAEINTAVWSSTPRGNIPIRRSPCRANSIWIKPCRSGSSIKTCRNRKCVHRGMATS